MAEGGPSGPTGEKGIVSFAEEPKMCWHVHILAEGFAAHGAQAMRGRRIHGPGGPEDTPKPAPERGRGRRAKPPECLVS